MPVNMTTLASVRCNVFFTGVRLFSKNYHQRLAKYIPKSRDIGSGYPRTIVLPRRFLSSQNNKTLPTTQFNKLLQRRCIDLKLSNVLPPEITALRSFSSEKPSSPKSPEENIGKSAAEDEASLTVFQRFKKTYKEHGKILIIVHCMTSVVWFGSFYSAAVSGFDIVPWMESLGLSDTIIKPFRAGGLGYVALAYLMYKLATPARYTVTLAGTNYAIKHLRKTGKMNPVPKGDNLRSLYKDGKSEFKERREVFQEKTGQRAAKFRKQRIFRRKDT